jgi:hypothetical protein
MKWEYKTINIEGKWLSQKMNTREADKVLNQEGMDGWELIATVPVTRTGAFTKQVATYAFVFVFKRPA